jgi:hypothetical protein
MSNQRQTSGHRHARRRIAGRAATVVLSSVVLVAFGSTTAWARPAPASTPTPTSTMTTNAGGTVTVNISGTWTWPVGSKKGDIAATSGSPCGPDFGVGWGVVWNDPNDPGFKITYKKKGTLYSTFVGVTGDPNNAKDASVHLASAQCGSYSPTAVTGTWTDSHVYAAGTVPTSVCVVNYILRNAKPGHKPQYVVNKNRKNSFGTAVKSGHGAGWTTSPACFDPSIASPTIVTTATNAQVGSPITDTSTLTGTTPDVTPVVPQLPRAVAANAGGTVIFTLYGPTDTTCTTPIFTSSALPVNGDGTYGPVTFTPTQGPGTYRWIATYSGDPSNNGATEVCGAPGEESTVTTAAVTSSSNPPTTNPSSSPSSSVPVVKTSSNGGGTAPVAVVGATTVHTGEPFAGSKPFVVALAAFGLSLMGFGYRQRRRIAVRKVIASTSTD